MSIRARSAATGPGADHRARRRRTARIASLVALTATLGTLAAGAAHPAPASAFYAEMCNGGASQPAKTGGYTPPVGPPSPAVLSFSGWAGCPGYHGGQYSIILQKQRWDGWQNLKSWTDYPDRSGRVTWAQLTYPCQSGTWTYRVVVNGWLVLAPSAFLWPHIGLVYAPPHAVGLAYAAPFARHSHQHRPVDTESLTAVLDALGDPTRLRVLQLISERPRSTQELAPLTGLGEAALSKHLRRLTDAGILRPRRDGYYVLYSLVRHPIASLSSSLLHLLDQPGSPE